MTAGSPYSTPNNPDEPKPAHYPTCPRCGAEWHDLPEGDCPTSPTQTGFDFTDEDLW